MASLNTTHIRNKKDREKTKEKHIKIKIITLQTIIRSYRNQFIQNVGHPKKPTAIQQVLHKRTTSRPEHFITAQWEINHKTVFQLL